MPARNVVRIVAIVAAVVVGLICVRVVVQIAERTAVAGLRHVLAGSGTRCGNLAVVTEDRLKSFERTYRLVQRVYGAGLGHCDSQSPNVRYTFVGSYLPGESRGDFTSRIARALTLDGWQVSAKDGSGAVAWTSTGPAGTQVTLALTSATYAELRNKPELVDLAATAATPFDRAERPALPEYGGPYPVPSLSQMTIFYPNPLPRGMARDTSLDIDAIDYSLALFHFTNDRGREANVDERPGPAVQKQPCDALGIVYRNALDAHPVCSMVAKTAGGIAVYAMTLPNAEFHGSTYYGLIRDGTVIVFGRAKIRTPPFDLTDVMKLANALAPTNPERKKF